MLMSLRLAGSAEAPSGLVPSRHSQIFHGADPESHRSLSMMDSR